VAENFHRCGTHCWGVLHINLGLRKVVVQWRVYEKGPVSSLNAVMLGADNDLPSYLLIKSLPSERPVITRRSKNFESLKVHSRRLSWMYDDNPPSLSTWTSVQIQRIYAPKSTWEEADIVGAANGETILRHSAPLTRLPKKWRNSIENIPLSYHVPTNRHCDLPDAKAGMRARY